MDLSKLVGAINQVDAAADAPPPAAGAEDMPEGSMNLSRLVGAISQVDPAGDAAPAPPATGPQDMPEGSMNLSRLVGAINQADAAAPQGMPDENINLGALVGAISQVGSEREPAVAEQYADPGVSAAPDADVDLSRLVSATTQQQAAEPAWDPASIAQLPPDEPEYRYISQGEYDRLHADLAAVDESIAKEQKAVKGIEAMMNMYRSASNTFELTKCETELKSVQGNLVRLVDRRLQINTKLEGAYPDPSIPDPGPPNAAVSPQGPSPQGPSPAMSPRGSVRSDDHRKSASMSKVEVASMLREVERLDQEIEKERKVLEGLKVMSQMYAAGSAELTKCVDEQHASSIKLFDLEEQREIFRRQAAGESVLQHRYSVSATAAPWDARSHYDLLQHYVPYEAPPSPARHVGDSTMYENAMSVLVTEERSFANDVYLLQTSFQQAIEYLQVLDADQTAFLFSNLADLYTVHYQLLEKLDQDNTVDAFVELAPVLEQHYLAFSANHRNAMDMVEFCKKNPVIKAYLDDCANRPELNGGEIHTFLIKPIQQIFRYPALLADLYYATDPNWPHFASVYSALTCMQALSATLYHALANQPGHIRLIQDEGLRRHASKTRMRYSSRFSNADMTQDAAKAARRDSSASATTSRSSRDVSKAREQERKERERQEKERQRQEKEREKERQKQEKERQRLEKEREKQERKEAERQRLADIERQRLEQERLKFLEREAEKEEREIARMEKERQREEERRRREEERQRQRQEQEAERERREAERQRQRQEQEAERERQRVAEAEERERLKEQKRREMEELERKREEQRQVQRAQEMERLAREREAAKKEQEARGMQRLQELAKLREQQQEAAAARAREEEERKARLEELARRRAALREKQESLAKMQVQQNERRTSRAGAPAPPALPAKPASTKSMFGPRQISGPVGPKPNAAPPSSALPPPPSALGTVSSIGRAGGGTVSSIGRAGGGKVAPPPMPSKPAALRRPLSTDDPLAQMRADYQRLKDEDRVEEAIKLRDEIKRLEAQQKELPPNEELIKLREDYLTAKKDDNIDLALTLRNKLRGYKGALEPRVAALSQEYNQAKKDDDIETALKLRDTLRALEAIVTL